MRVLFVPSRSSAFQEPECPHRFMHFPLSLAIQIGRFKRPIALDNQRPGVDQQHAVVSVGKPDRPPFLLPFSVSAPSL